MARYGHKNFHGSAWFGQVWRGEVWRDLARFGSEQQQ